jgi:hypothetical protein
MVSARWLYRGHGVSLAIECEGGRTSTGGGTEGIEEYLQVKYLAPDAS